jgi:hypothetical protein
VAAPSPPVVVTTASLVVTVVVVAVAVLVVEGVGGRGVATIVVVVGGGGGGSGHPCRPRHGHRCCSGGGGGAVTWPQCRCRLLSPLLSVVVGVRRWGMYQACASCPCLRLCLPLLSFAHRLPLFAPTLVHLHPCSFAPALVRAGPAPVCLHLPLFVQRLLLFAHRPWSFLHCLLSFSCASPADSMPSCFTQMTRGGWVQGRVTRVMSLSVVAVLLCRFSTVVFYTDDAR